MDKFAFKPRDKPTFYYIGVSTRQSSIMRVFPRWAEYLNLDDPDFVGINCKIHADKQKYRKIVKFIKDDDNSLGALVTSHKIDLYEAAQDLFDEVGNFAQLLGEVSCISKSDKMLIGHAKDPITSGLAFDSFIPKNHWKDTGGEIFIIGAGGASLALTTYIMRELDPDNRPSKIYISNRSIPRLEKMEEIHKIINPGIEIEYFHHPNPEQNDEIVNNLIEGSLVINGTGLGKDAPGSPITDDAEFPQNGFAWDYNYRGDLVFLDQARAQAEEKDLHFEDGWIYFLHGWTRVIAEVFHIDIPIEGPKFEEISQIAVKAK
jgi:shikimate 5-dehydrogenase